MAKIARLRTDAEDHGHHQEHGLPAVQQAHPPASASKIARKTFRAACTSHARSAKFYELL